MVKYTVRRKSEEENGKREKEETRPAAEPVRQPGPVRRARSRRASGDGRTAFGRGKRRDCARRAQGVCTQDSCARHQGPHGRRPDARFVRLQLQAVFRIRDLLQGDPRDRGRSQARPAPNHALPLGEGRRAVHQGRQHRRPRHAVPPSRRRLHRRRDSRARQQALGRGQGLPHRRAGELRLALHRDAACRDALHRVSPH